MLGYKDKTFCPFYTECEKGEGCSRVLTDEVWEDSKRIGLPVSQYTTKPSCFKVKQVLTNFNGQDILTEYLEG